MSDRLRALGLILLAASMVVFVPCRRADSSTPPRRGGPLRCTRAALAALKPIPQFDYECAERDEDNLKTPERQAALKDYLSELESAFDDAAWWAAPVADLNVCSIIHEGRAMTARERQDFRGNNDEINLYGDGSTRLVVVADPCIKYSYGTLNAYVLQRADRRVYATQVLDAFYTRADNSVRMRLAARNGERLMIIERGLVDGMMPPQVRMTWAVYAINPRTRRAVPRKIFKENGRLSNELTWDAPPFEDEEAAARWRAPEIERDGRLLPRFHLYYPYKGRLGRDTYVWNGRYYARAR
jgi:hypothetical protein